MPNLIHSAPISTVDASGAYVATGGYDNRVILWDALTREPLAQGMHDHLVNHCAFSHDGTALVTASSDYSARIWEVPSLRLQCVLGGHADDVDMAAFSPDDTMVATCALDRAVRLFDRAGRCLRTFLGHTGNIISLVWSADGSRLVTSSVDGTVREWDIARMTPGPCHDLDAVRTDTVVLDAEGRILAGDDRGRLAVIDGNNVRYLAAHRAGIKKLLYRAKDRILVSLSYDRTLAVWTCDVNGQPSRHSMTEMPATIWSRAATFLDSTRIALGTFGSCYAVYDWVGDTWDTTGVAAGDGINAVAFHQGSIHSVGDAGRVMRDGIVHAELGSLCNFLLPAGGHLYAGGQLGQLFDADTGEILYRHHSPLNCAARFDRAGAPFMAIGSYTGEVLIFALAQGRAMAPERVLDVYENAVKGIVAAGDMLFSVCASTDVAWHSTRDYALVRRISRAHDKIANSCSIAGAGGFASVSRDRTLRLWIDGKVEVYPSPHPNSVKSMCASADGMTIMTGSYGGTLAAFDVAARQWKSFSRPTTSGIASIAYDPLQGRFLAASYDGEVHVAR